MQNAHYLERPGVDVCSGLGCRGFFGRHAYTGIPGASIAGWRLNQDVRENVKPTDSTYSTLRNTWYKSAALLTKRGRYVFGTYSSS